MGAQRGSVIRDYVGLTFNPDKYVFQMLMMLSMCFMVMYVIGTSVPAWYVLQEGTSNFSTCETADSYVGTHERRSWSSSDYDVVNIQASLWYLNINVRGITKTLRAFMPFLLIHKEPPQQYVLNGE